MQQGYPGLDTHFPQWQQGVGPAGENNGDSRWPGQNLLPFLKQGQNGQNLYSNTCMPMLSSGYDLQNIHGPDLKKRKKRGKSGSVDHQWKVNNVPHMQDSAAGVSRKQYYTYSQEQDTTCSQVQNSNSHHSQYQNSNSYLSQNPNSISHHSQNLNRNSHHSQNQNSNSHHSQYQNNNDAFNCGPSVQNNNNFSFTKTSQKQSVESIPDSNKFIQKKKKVKKFKKSFDWKSKLEKDQTQHGAYSKHENVEENNLKPQLKKLKFKQFQSIQLLHQKVANLEEELVEKNQKISILSKEVEDFKEKTAEVVKGNIHLVNVIKGKDSELDSNKLLIFNMKDEIKSAQKNVLNCLQKKLAETKEVVAGVPLKTDEKMKGHGVTGDGVGSIEKLAIEDDSTSLSLEIKRFLEFNCLSQKIAASFEKAMRAENSSEVATLDLKKKEVETSIIVFQTNVTTLFREVIFMIKKRVEVKNSLIDVEKKIKKAISDIGDFLDKLKKTSLKDVKKSELKTYSAELKQLKKSRRKLENDKKQMIEKLNAVNSNLL